MGSPTRVAAAWLIALACLSGGSRAQTWYEEYDEATAAIAAERWSDALEHLDRALEQRPSSGARVRTYGMRFVDYFPYLQLGTAYLHLDQLDAATAALDTSERQGSIDSSPSARSQLADVRRLLDERTRSAARELQERTDTLTSRALAEADTLENNGDLEGALGAVDRVLALSPDHAVAAARRSQLREALQRSQADEQRRRAVQTLIETGRVHLRRGEPDRAAASFAEALTLDPSEPVRALHRQALTALRSAEVESPGGPGAESEAARISRIGSALARARELGDSGRTEQALAQLQRVFADEPQHAEARGLQRQWQTELNEERQRTLLQEGLDELLASAQRLLERGDFAASLQTSNRALALAPDHPEALRQLALGYRGLSGKLLTGTGAAPTILIDGWPELSVAQPEGERLPPRLFRGSSAELTGKVLHDAETRLVARCDGAPCGEIRAASRPIQGVTVTEFTWFGKLPFGLSTVEIVATDGAGLSTTIQAPMRRSTPIYRRIWFWIGVALLTLAALATGRAVRHVRRRRLIRRRFNPYVAGAPVLEQKRFFGRGQLLDYVLRRVGNNSIMLHGERRIGKTSFQHHLKQRLEGYDDGEHVYHPVFVDLQGVPQERFFATLGSEIFHQLGSRLELDRPDSATSLDDERYGYRDLQRDLQFVIDTLRSRQANASPGAERKVKLVLLIDEVDELNSYEPRVNQRLRSLFMRAFAESLVAVVSGVGIKKRWDREGSPWYNFFQEIEVKPFDPDEARELIEGPVRGVFAFADGTADEIVRRTTGKPYLIQRSCAALVERLHQEGRHTVTLEDVHSVGHLEGASE